ncbi:MAG: tyrosine-type recombinase/integrase [Rhodospirillaceae bacterium]
MTNQPPKTVRYDSITKHQVMTLDRHAQNPEFVRDVYDDSCAGLLVRVTAQSATWYVRGRLGGKQKMWKIADLKRDDDPPVMRSRAQAARDMAKRGIDPKDWLLEQVVGGPVLRHFDPTRDGWTWEEAREAFLEKVNRENKPATFADYRKTLYSADLRPFNGKLVKHITKIMIQSIQTDIVNRGKKTQAAHTTRILKVCLTWVAECGKSGLADSPGIGVKVVKKTKFEKAREDEDRKERLPTLDEIGDLPWLLAAARVNSAARLAATLALLTGQRRETIAAARKQDFKPNAHGAIWTIPAAYMKSNREHVIPIPHFTLGVVHAAAAMSSSESDWLFPQLRLRRVGDPGTGHMSCKQLNDAMASAGSPIRPHGCRSAFGTYGESLLGFGRSDTKAILDHAEGQSNDVTAQHYILHDGTHFKWRLMRTWEGWVQSQIAARRPLGLSEKIPAFLAN